MKIGWFKTIGLVLFALNLVIGVANTVVGNVSTGILCLVWAAAVLLAVLA